MAEVLDRLGLLTDYFEKITKRGIELRRVRED